MDDLDLGLDLDLELDLGLMDNDDARSVASSSAARINFARGGMNDDDFDPLSTPISANLNSKNGESKVAEIARLARERASSEAPSIELGRRDDGSGGQHSRLSIGVDEQDLLPRNNGGKSIDVDMDFDLDTGRGDETVMSGGRDGFVPVEMEAETGGMDMDMSFDGNDLDLQLGEGGQRHRETSEFC